MPHKILIAGIIGLKSFSNRNGETMMCSRHKTLFLKDAYNPG